MDSDSSKVKEMLTGKATVEVRVLKDYEGHATLAEIVIGGHFNAVIEFELDWDADVDEYGRTVDASCWRTRLKSGSLPEGFLEDVGALKHRDLDDYAYDIEGFLDPVLQAE